MRKFEKISSLTLTGGIIAGFIVVALAGMYKFNYLVNQSGYDVDGNQMESK